MLAANGVPGSFVVPVGLPFPGDAHDAVLSVIGVSLSPSAPVYQHVASEPLDLPGCGLLTLETPYVPIPMAVDFVNATSCAQDALLKFRLCEPARVTLRVEGTVFEGEILGPGSPAPPVATNLGPVIDAASYSRQEFASGRYIVKKFTRLRSNRRRTTAAGTSWPPARTRSATLASASSTLGSQRYTRHTR